jgi:hypothetical protein
LSGTETRELETTPLPVRQPSAEGPEQRPEPECTPDNEPEVVAPQRLRLRSRFWRGLTGALAAGLAVLAAAVLGARVIGLFTSAPGPTVPVVIGHPVAAVLAVGAQRVADVRRGTLAGLAGAAVVVIVVFALWLFWWY